MRKESVVTCLTSGGNVCWEINFSRALVPKGGGVCVPLGVHAEPLRAT